jgi:hypothetical protein
MQAKKMFKSPAHKSILAREFVFHNEHEYILIIVQITTLHVSVHPARSTAKHAKKKEGHAKNFFWHYLFFHTLSQQV